MSWTVWQRRSRCENCGAKIPVPPQGLYVTCEYCGSEAPVPDMEARRQIMERQARETRSAEKNRRTAREQPASPPSQKGHRLVIILILFVVVMVGAGTCIPGLVISMLTRTGMESLVKASQEQATTATKASQEQATKAAKAGKAAQQNRVAGQAASTTRKKASASKPGRRRRQRPARNVERPAPRPGPDRQLNAPPPVHAPRGAGPGFEVPETDLDRALEDDDL